MKIAFLSFYSGNVYRGVETFVHEVANRLSKDNEVTVYQAGPAVPNSKYKTVTISEPVEMDKRSNYIPFINYFARKVGWFSVKSLKVLDKDTDVVFPTNGQWQSVLSRIWTIEHGAKMVIAGQSGPGLDDRVNLFSFPNTFIGLTDFQVNWAKKANPFVKIAKIANGVDLHKFNQKTPPLKLDLPKPIILCVAALDFWKRNELIIKAVSKMKNGSLLLVGKGTEEKKLQYLGNSLLPGRFKLVSCPHDQMPLVYKAANLFTFATVPWESFGIVLVEAMASGLPVVATDDKIRREIVGNAGLFVNVENSEEYAVVLQKALKIDWKDLPRKQAEKFSWDNIAGAYEKLFDRLISGSR